MRAAVAIRPQSDHPLMNLGNGYSFLGQQDEAIQYYRKALELNPRGGGIYTNLGTALVRKGQYEEAISAYEQSIKLRPGHYSKETCAALSMIYSNCPDTRLRNLRRAVELAEKAVELDPKASDHWTALGVARYRESQWQEARIALDRSLKLEDK